MSKKTALLSMLVVFSAGAAQAQSPLLGELELKAATRSERNAGVWLDGQYVGFVGDLRGGDRLVLVPGSHELLFRLIGYQDVSTSITIEPDQKAEYVVSMEPRPGVTYPSKEDTARLRIEVEPSDAAVFVDRTFVGHVDRFDDRSGMRIEPGTYRFTIALPGYESFQTELTLRARQTYEIKTELAKGRLSDQAAELIAGSPELASQSD